MDFDQIYALILTGVIAPMFAYAVAKICSWIDAKTDAIKNEKIQKALKAARIELESAVQKAVVQVNETFVTALKTEGNFTEEDAKLALEKSITITKNIMSEAAIVALQNASIIIDDAIKTEVEIQLPTINNKTTCVDTSTKVEG